jgi:hypothetical protein
MISRETKLDKFITFLVALPLVALLFVVVYTIEAIVFRLLWNWLIVDIFKLRPISLIESIGLIFLCLLIFGSKNKTEWGK